MAGHLVALAALFVQPQPQLLAMLKQVSALRRDCRTDPRKAVTSARTVPGRAGQLKCYFQLNPVDGALPPLTALRSWRA
jgi:hypothetical protein